MAQIYDSSHSGQEIDAAVDAVQTTIPSQLTQIGLELDDIEERLDNLATGKYYGYYSSANGLPTEGTDDGYAYVGTAAPFSIYNGTASGGRITWADSGAKVSDAPIADGSTIEQNASTHKLSIKDNGIGIGKIKIGALGYVTPETYGAKGDGVTDDTAALRSAFQSGFNVYLANTYIVSSQLSLSSSIFGHGTIKSGAADARITISGNCISFQDITIDGSGRESVSIVSVSGGNDISFVNCKFKDVGAGGYSVARFVSVQDNSHNIGFYNCSFVNCISASDGAATGICVTNTTEDETMVSDHIVVNGCYFENINPSSDADAVKVIGLNYDCDMYVTNCTFKRCGKRALKFQGRQCHSANNTIYLTSYMYACIDFQRGNGTSINDTIIIDYDSSTSTLGGNGELYYALVYICGNNVTIDGLNVIGENMYSSGNQQAFRIAHLEGYTSADVTDISIRNCNIFGGGIFMYCATLTSITRLVIDNVFFNNGTANNNLFRIGACALTDCKIKMYALGTYSLYFNMTDFDTQVTYSEIDMKARVQRLHSTRGSSTNIIRYECYLDTTNIYRYEIIHGRMTMWARVATSPSGATASNWSAVRLAKVGDIVYLISPILSGDSTSIQLGWICTADGTTSAGGTFVKYNAAISS